jgi:hypothetical protein
VIYFLMEASGAVLGGCIGALTGIYIEERWFGK